MSNDEETRAALADLYRLVKDYDLDMDMKDSANEIDDAQPLVDGVRWRNE